MELLNKFLNEYATLLIYTALTAIFGVVAAFIKKKYNEWADTKTKKEVVKICVTAVQQMYQELDGSEKKEKAIEAISDMLAEKGIAITTLEINLLIEACIGEFKGVFDDTEDDEYDVSFTTDNGFIYDDGEGLTLVEFGPKYEYDDEDYPDEEDED